MKKRLYGIIIIVACVMIIICGLFYIGRSVIIRYTGKKVTAVVTDIPFQCDKYNHIRILLNGKQYEINISKNNCREGLYKVGQKVELIKHDNYEELVWPQSHPEFVY